MVDAESVYQRGAGYTGPPFFSLGPHTPHPEAAEHGTQTKAS